MTQQYQHIVLLVIYNTLEFSEIKSVRCTVQKHIRTSITIFRHIFHE
jgi:hypothetical protein